MNISAPFIKRPVGTSLLAAALLLSGGLAFNFLPVAPLPQVEFPVISVSAGLPGASPETMASAGGPSPGRRVWGGTGPPHINPAHSPGFPTQLPPAQALPE